MRKILITVMMMLSVYCNAQTKENISRKDGETVVSEVVEAKDKTSQQIYESIIIWVNKFFANPKSVIQSQNDDLKLIVLSCCLTDNKDLTSWYELNVSIQCKDGRYKYEMNNIWLRWSASFHSYGAVDKPYDKARIENKNLDTTLISSISSFVNGMKKAVLSNDNDW